MPARGRPALTGHDWPMIGQAFAPFGAVLGAQDRGFSLTKPLFIAGSRGYGAGAVILVWCLLREQRLGPFLDFARIAPLFVIYLFSLLNRASCGPEAMWLMGA